LPYRNEATHPTRNEIMVGIVIGSAMAIPCWLAIIWVFFG
jgi:type III secretory pathway component EscT